MSLCLVDMAFLSTMKFLRDTSTYLVQKISFKFHSSVYSYMVVPTLSANPVHLGEEDHRAGHPNKVEGNDTDQVV